MTQRKELGKIAKAEYGFGGYQEAMFGLSVQLSLNGGGTGCGHFEGGWAERAEYAKYSQEEWVKSHVDCVKYVRDLLSDAKVMSVSKLVGIPVEATIEGARLVSWRILKEVL